MAVYLDSFNSRFISLHSRSVDLIEKTPADRLYWRPRDLGKTFAMFSCGEYILRSASAVEQTFGGITTRLWDDPFEWTLPEKLSSSEHIIEYLHEVEATRTKGFAFFTSDEDLARKLPSPERLRSIFDILLDTLARAEHFQGRAYAIFQMFSNEKLPRIY